MKLGVRAALVDGEVVEGDVAVADGLVVGVGEGGGGHGLAVPGFVDLQVNGFAGVDFLACDSAGYRAARSALLERGVTSFLPTLVTAPVEVLEAALTVAAESGVLGVHLEGPFLSPSFKGAHDERRLVEPDLAVADRLLARGPVAMMTVAPERPGGMDLVRGLVERGVVVSLGHTDADAATAHAAFDAGAKAVTHLFNAQRRFTARDPGVSGVALSRPDVAVGVIADFVHLAPETVLLAWRAAAGRLVLVSDAVAAAGTGITEVRLEDGTLAGGAVGLDECVRNLASLGVPVAAAVAAATAVPAALIGRPELGTLRPGTPADIVVLDEDDLSVSETVAAASCS